MGGVARVRILVLGDDSEGVAGAVVDELSSVFDHVLVDHVARAEQVPGHVGTLAADECVALGVVTSEVGNVDAVLDVCADLPALADTKWLVVTTRQLHDDVDRALEEGRLWTVITVPWNVPLMLGQCHAVILRHLQEEGLGQDRILALVGPPPPSAVQGPLLTGLDLPEVEVMRHLLDGVEAVLGPRPRIRVDAGVDLTRQGERISAVLLVLDGSVSLHRDTERGELLLHHATSGPLIGLVSIACGEAAFFTATTSEPTTVVRMSNEQLRAVLVARPEVGSILAVLAIQSLTRRLMRAEDLHVEKDLLAADLEAERAKLARTLEALRATREELVDKTRFAMLGELSAGIAHELNNPVTALVRAAEFLGKDVGELLGASPQTAPARTSLERALTAPPRSTAAERQLVAEVLPAVGGDRALARRLVKAGVGDAARAKELRSRPEQELAAIEAGARVGSSLRSVLAASERVIALTASLKGYARPDADQVCRVEVAAGVEDVLRLTGHRLHGIEVETDFAPCPPIMAHPGKLQQVWTNLLVNAAEAIEDGDADAAEAGRAPARGQNVPARIHVRVVPGCDPEGRDTILVEIRDNGPGIPPELVQRIFEPHFTTKAGRVRYGLGLGMSICRSIVTDLGGDLRIESRPGDTRILIHLPLDGAGGDRGGSAGLSSGRGALGAGTIDSDGAGPQVGAATVHGPSRRGLPPSTTVALDVRPMKEER